MRALIVGLGMVLFSAPDAGIDAQARQHDIVLAELRCDDSDGGVFVERVHDCLVRCAGRVPSARLLDGGPCPERVKAIPMIPGDIWTPGERPYLGGGRNPPRSR